MNRHDRPFCREASGREEPRTVRTWLDACRDLTRQDRELLLGTRLGVDRTALVTEPGRIIPEHQTERLADDVARLRAGEPLAYVIGEAGFWDFLLEVTPAVLIPRPETETLIEQALTRIAPGDHVLDLGTGSGAIAIALARSTECRVLAVDRSEAALQVARRNAGKLIRSEAAAITFRLSNWFSQVPERFQMIVANPPYVAAGDPHLPALSHEPMDALVSGPHGLDDLSAIIDAAPAHLTPGGWLVTEHGYDQADAVRELFTAAGFKAVEGIRDLGGRPRITLGRHGTGGAS